jgi:hypothetical protein
LIWDEEQGADMGGLGSGKWNREPEKTSAEECHQIDVRELARRGMLKVGSRGTYLAWTGVKDDEKPPREEFLARLAGDFSSDEDEESLDVAYATVADDAGRRYLQLSYRLWDDEWGDSADAESDVCQLVPLQTTRPYYGGLRWWFTCPLCNRRVGKLYLPDAARYFGCWHCHDLVYRREPDPLEHASGFVKAMRSRLEHLRKKHGRQRRVGVPCGGQRFKP